MGIVVSTRQRRCLQELYTLSLDFQACDSTFVLQISPVYLYYKKQGPLVPERDAKLYLICFCFLNNAFPFKHQRPVFCYEITIWEQSHFQGRSCDILVMGKKKKQ